MNPSPAPRRGHGQGRTHGQGPGRGGPARAHARPRSGVRARMLTVLGCVASGVAIAAALPPWGWWPLALVGFAGLDLLLAGRGRASRFRRGWLVAAAWLYPSTIWMLDFSPPAFAAAGAVLGLFVAVACVFVPAGPGRHLALPGAMALAELARWSTPFGGVPLSTVPMTQADAPLAPLARLGGGLALTLATVAVGVALAALVERRPKVAVAVLAPVAVAFAVTLLLPRSHDVGGLEVALVQGGGAQRTRAVDSDARVVFQRHLDASAFVRPPVDLVVWPENVVNLDQLLGSSPEASELSELARRLDATVVPGVVEPAGPGHFTNYSVVIDPEGRFGDRYDKVQRVPFGEYVPFRWLMGPLSGGLLDTYVPKDAVAGTAPAVLDSQVGKLGVVISWEVFFERRARDAVVHGAEVILNPTNGSSYWLTVVQSQQVASSRLRALETDRWVLQTAPTGFSALVDPDGAVVQRTRIGEQRVVQGQVQRRHGLSLASRLGPWPWLTGAALLVAAGWAVDARRREVTPPATP